MQFIQLLLTFYIFIIGLPISGRSEMACENHLGRLQSNNSYCYQVNNDLIENNAKIRRRIAIISDHGDPAMDTIGTEGAGGQNVFVRQTGEHLSKIGWTVDMFTRKWKPYQDDIVTHNPNCRTIRLKAGPVTIISRDKLLDHMDEFLKSFLQFQHQDKLHYDIIHTNYWLSGVVGLKLKAMYPSTKLVHVCHSLGMVKQAWLLETTHKNNTNTILNSRHFYEKDIIEKANLVIATSSYEALDIYDYSPSIDKKKVVIIPGGVNWNFFGLNSPTRFKAREEIGLDQDSKLVLYVGRFDQRKGIDVLVNAISQSEFRNHPKLLLVIAGGKTAGMADEIEFKRIEHLVQLNKLENLTNFIGILSHRDRSLEFWYSAADVVVVPSYYEPFGLVAVEAMAVGTPVVASAVGGLQSTIIHGLTGFLVKPGDHVEFSKSIDTILKDPVLQNNLGNFGRKRVKQHFTWEVVTEQVNTQLQQLLRS